MIHVRNIALPAQLNVVEAFRAESTLAFNWKGSGADAQVRNYGSVTKDAVKSSWNIGHQPY